MIPCSSSSSALYAGLSEWLLASQLEDLHAVAACLARLQRCLDRLQSPGLEEVRRIELGFYLDGQTRLLNRHVHRLLWADQAPERPAALDALLAGLVHWSAANHPQRLIALRRPLPPMPLAMPVAGCCLALHLLLENAQWRAPTGCAIEVGAVAGPDGMSWLGQVGWVANPLAPRATVLRNVTAARAAPGRTFGLGLSLAEQLLQASGGCLWEDGQGAGLHFRLPRLDAKRRWTVLRPRLLVIDDDADMRAYLAENLERAGFDTRTAADGDAALDLAGTFAPHLVLLDMQIAPIGGNAIMARLRGISDAAVVFLSAIDDKARVAESLWLGAADCVTKPFHMRELVARAHAILRRRLTTAAGPEPLRPVSYPRFGTPLGQLPN